MRLLPHASTPPDPAEQALWLARRRVGLTGARLAGALAAAVLALVAAPSPATAHNTLTATSPADGQSVPRTPTQLVLTFDETVVALGSQVVVAGPSGPAQQGPPRLLDSTVTQPLRPGLPAGAYTVTWRVTSVDGHPISGTFGFTSRAASAGQPPGAEAPAPDEPAATPGPVPGWLLVVLGAAVLALVITGLRLAAGRRRGGG